MASRPDPTTLTTSCPHASAIAARVVPTLLWSSAIKTRTPFFAEPFMPDTFLVSLLAPHLLKRGDAHFLRWPALFRARVARSVRQSAADDDQGYESHVAQR